MYFVWLDCSQYAWIYRLYTRIGSKWRERIVKKDNDQNKQTKIFDEAKKENNFQLQPK